MNIQCLIPKFLQSEVLENPIISTKDIVTVSYDRLNDPRCICFSFENKPNIYWEFNTKTKAIKAYCEIKEQLKDRKVIQK